VPIHCFFFGGGLINSVIMPRCSTCCCNCKRFYLNKSLLCVLFCQIDKDDGIRPGTTMEILAKLKPAFTENGSTTAG